MNNKFFTFIKPYLSYLDNGNLYRQPFSWLYIILAAVNLLFPFYVLYLAIDGHIFDMPGKFIFAFILFWLVLLFAGWLSFQLWWDRKENVLKTATDGSRYPATPVVAHFIQTFGEWLGTWIAVVGFSFALIATIFLGSQASYLSSGLDLPLNAGIASIILMPIYGFLIIVFSRLLAEQLRALVDIASNTKK
jgi:hypothetical protein